MTLSVILTKVRISSLWEIAGQARNDAARHSDESQNLIIMGDCGNAELDSVPQ
jgi:hypothetical protein